MKTHLAETDCTMKLSDGRQLGYAEYGDPSGFPVFYNHSGSRLDLRTFSPVAAAQGVRLISPDRPGIGLSDFRPGYRFLDWPDDLAELADHLKLAGFAMMGHSSGTVFTLACAHKIPERMTRCALVGAAAPFDAPGVTDGMMLAGRLIYSLARRTSWPARAQTAMMARLVRSASDQRIAQSTLKGLSGPDKNAMIEQPELLHDIVVAAGRETFRSGNKGATRMTLLLARPWGFSLEEIQVPVRIWQGAEDTNAPVAMAEYLARTIPHCQLRIMTNEGHLSPLANHMEEILGDLVAPH